MVFFFGKKKKKFLSLDIGTESVKGITFCVSEKKIFIENASLAYLDNFNIFDTLDFPKEVMRRAITKVCSDLFSNKETIDKALISLPEKNIFERLASWQTRRATPGQKISRKEQESIYGKAIEDSYASVQKEMGINGKDLELLDKNVSEGRINGYEIKELQGYKGGDIDLSVYLAFADKKYIKGFREYFADFSWQQKILVSTNGAILDNFAYERSSVLFLDIGGDVTKILAIKAGWPFFAGQINQGSHHLTLALASALGMSHDTARDFKHRYSDGVLSSQTAKQVKEVLAIDLRQWSGDLSRELEGKGFRPSKIYLFGGGAQLLDYRQEVSRIWPNVSADRMSAKNFSNLLKPGQTIDTFSPVQFLPAIINSTYAIKWNF
ncbi:MAG TPA: hypothetical protein PKM84_00885 [Candidatus Pacearchaeota archaeon]|nr:hypothetical protein [Candidatus Pacearchaeota archaeon]